MSDNVRCVVLYKERKSLPWDLCFIVEKKSLGWETAASIEEQERLLGIKDPKAIICLESDYDQGIIKAIKPPMKWRTIKPAAKEGTITNAEAVAAFNPVKDELAKKLKESSLNEVIQMAKNLGIKEEIINNYTAKSPGLAKMLISNAIRNFNKI